VITRSASLYRDRVDEEPVTIKLTHDQAFVLSDWLYEVMMRSDKLDAIVPDRAVWSAIYAISGPLETTLPEIFMPDYTGRLEQARQRLLNAVGGDEDDTAETSEHVSSPPSGYDTSDRTDQPERRGRTAAKHSNPRTHN